MVVKLGVFAPLGFVYSNDESVDARVGVFKWYYFSQEKYHGLTTLNMFIIAVGVAIAAYGEINFIWIGVIEQFSALIFEATRLCLVQILIKNKGYAMNPIQSLYYVSPSVWIIFVGAIFDRGVTRDHGQRRISHRLESFNLERVVRVLVESGGLFVDW